MSQLETDNVLKFSNSIILDREELADLIRQTLVPSEFFKMHASKVRHGTPVEVIKFNKQSSTSCTKNVQ